MTKQGGALAPNPKPPVAVLTIRVQLGRVERSRAHRQRRPDELR